MKYRQEVDYTSMTITRHIRFSIVERLIILFIGKIAQDAPATPEDFIRRTM